MYGHILVDCVTTPFLKVRMKASSFSLLPQLPLFFKLLQVVSFFFISCYLIMMSSSESKSVDAISNSQPINNQRRTFYRRPLPDSCISLSSEEGQARFASALARKGLKSFFPLIEQFTTQSEPAYCGISTLVIVLNSLAMDPRRTWKGPWRWYHEGLLNCCLDLEVVKNTGITIQDFRCLAMCQGLTADTVLADEDDNSRCGSPGVEQFRTAVQKACVVTDETDNHLKDEMLVVSYSRAVLGQTGGGHFSPIAAYDPISDSVLILDTARFKYGAHWVGVSLLFDAMKPKDPDTGRSRGYILLSDHDHHSYYNNDQDDGAPSLIPSVLFRSQRKQNPVRREYKKFLEKLDHEPTLDQIISFWTKDGSEPKFIWQMMDPQLSPLEDDVATIGLINSVRTLLVDKLISRETNYTFPETCCDCRVNFSRTLPLLPQEAIFIVYLASLSEAKRKEIVLGDEPKIDNAAVISVAAADTEAQTQILAEAELVRYAIDMSDEPYDAP